MRLPEKREIEEGLAEVAETEAAYMADVVQNIEWDDEALYATWRNGPCSHDTCPTGWCNVSYTTDPEDTWEIGDSLYDYAFDHIDADYDP